MSPLNDSLIEQTAIVPQEYELSVESVHKQIQKIQQAMKSFMKKDEHYGIIPGTHKPTLYKAGAEKLAFMFKFAPTYEINRSELKEGHREYEITCHLLHQVTGRLLSDGVGSCSTLESKYRYRQAKMRCPMCSKEGSIIKGKLEFGGGWVCYRQKGGCNAKFAITDTVITLQPKGKIENPDIADSYNTVLKMAKKRAQIDATLSACAASDIFGQDLEDTDVETTIQNAKDLQSAEDKIKYSLSRVELENVYKNLSSALRSGLQKQYQAKTNSFGTPPIASAPTASLPAPVASKVSHDIDICKASIEKAITQDELVKVFSAFPLQIKDQVREEFVKKAQSFKGE